MQMQSQPRFLPSPKNGDIGAEEEEDFRMKNWLIKCLLEMNQKERSTFIEFCTAAANEGVNCDLTADGDEDDERDDDGERASSKRKAASTVPGSRSPAKKAKPKASPGDASNSNEHAGHVLAAISSIRGFKGGRQQLCGVCSPRFSFSMYHASQRPPSSAARSDFE